MIYDKTPKKARDKMFETDHLYQTIKKCFQTGDYKNAEYLIGELRFELSALKYFAMEAKLNEEEGKKNAYVKALLRS